MYLDEILNLKMQRVFAEPGMLAVFCAGPDIWAFVLNFFSDYLFQMGLCHLCKLMFFLCDRQFY